MASELGRPLDRSSLGGRLPRLWERILHSTHPENNDDQMSYLQSYGTKLWGRLVSPAKNPVTTRRITSTAWTDSQAGPALPCNKTVENQDQLWPCRGGLQAQHLQNWIPLLHLDQLNTDPKHLPLHQVVCTETVLTDCPPTSD